MTTYVRQCKTCGIEFEANRSDAAWCSGKCVAKYYRMVDNPDMTHAAKEHNNFHVCEECGQGYTINDYAERGGKRAPKYCSVKCKQKAYRGRQQQQAARRNAGTGSKQDAGSKQDTGRQRGQSSGSGHTGQSRQEQNQNRRSRADKRDPYTILGVARGASKAEIRKAWKTLITKWHPDKNPDNVQEATERSQDINWAYDQIGR